MSQISPSLVVLAGGLGSRFGGDKQLAVLPGLNKTIMELSIADAYAAGVRHVVLVIRAELEGTLRARLRSHVPHDLKLDFAIQPRPCDMPELHSTRSKPLGTGHALHCAAPYLKHDFMVITADDYYGKRAFSQLLDKWNPTAQWRMLGYALAQTLSNEGGVNRGICQLNENNELKSINEVYNIDKHYHGELIDKRNVQLDASSLSSMTIWALSHDFLQRLEQGFAAFIQQLEHNSHAEFVLTNEIQRAITQRGQRVKVLPAIDRWYGVTYKDDLAKVAKHIAYEIQGHACCEGLDKK